MYINFNLLLKSGLSAESLMLLQIIHQKEYSRLENCDKQTLINLFFDGYVTKINPPKKDTPKYMLARLTEKGKKFLKDLSIAELTDESRALAGRLISLYETNNLNIGVKKKIVEKVAWFLAESVIEPDKIFQIISDYINITPKEYTSSLDNLLWKGESVFATKWTLSQSKLYGLCTK